MTSNTSSHASNFCSRLGNRIKSALASSDGLARIKRTRQAVTVGAVLAVTSNSAFAQAAGLTGLCDMAGWLKTIAGAVALIAIFLLVINSFFGKNEVIGDIITKVLMGCAIMAAGGALISSAGLTPCSI